MLTVLFGKSTVCITGVQLWHNLFKECREDVNKDAHPIRPSMSININNENFEADPKITIRKADDDVGVSFGSCQLILTDALGMKQTAAKIVPKLLNFEQIQLRNEHRSADIDDIQRRFEEMSMTMLILGDQSPQQSMNTLKQ